MPQLECAVPMGLWEALQAKSKAAGQPEPYIVNRALTEYLHADHHTLYQVSTATALVEGIDQGAVRIGDLRQHGDLGLGTFEELDGEMTTVGREFYQILSDGSVRQVGTDVLTPFAVITQFVPSAEITIDKCPSMSDLTTRLDTLRISDNLFYPLRVDGTFDHIHARAVGEVKPGERLLQATAAQTEFDFHDISGTLVGFWTPEYARTLNVPGYHLHFLCYDRTRGGHLLQCSGCGLRLQIQREGEYHVALPETADFLKADLRRDPSAALAQAEGEKK